MPALGAGCGALVRRAPAWGLGLHHRNLGGQSIHRLRMGGGGAENGSLRNVTSQARFSEQSPDLEIRQLVDGARTCLNSSGGSLASGLGQCRPPVSTWQGIHPTKPGSGFLGGPWAAVGVGTKAPGTPTPQDTQARWALLPERASGTSAAGPLATPGPLGAHGFFLGERGLEPTRGAWGICLHLSGSGHSWASRF